MPSRWFTSLSDNQKKDAQRKFQQASVDDRQKFSSEQNFLAVDDKQNFSSVDDGEDFDTGEDFSFDPIDNVSDDHCDLTQEDKPAEDNSQHGYVLPVDITKASQITGLPTLILRQIWSKAADLLSASNHVMPAPGCSKMARMVASSSQAKPHFVTNTDDGRFECDESCPAFRQRYICSHTIATAESNGLLLSFLENYCKYAKTPKGSRSVTPNYTQLSMVNLPRRTAGRKGGKAPKKKAISRRKVTPSEQRQPLSVECPGPPAFASTSATSNIAPGNSTESLSKSSPSVTVITTSSGNWNWNWDGISTPSFHSMPSPYPPYFPPSLPPSYPPPSYPTFYPPAMPYHSPLTDVSNCYPYSYGAPTGPGPSSSYSKQRSCGSPVTPEPFLIKFLNGRIKVCAGCKGPHMKDAKNGLLPPPHDICIGHCEPLTFLNPRTGLESSKMGNAYYHVNLSCIKKKHPDFIPSQLICEDDIKRVLQPPHFQFLWDTLGLSIQ